MVGETSWSVAGYAAFPHALQQERRQHSLVVGIGEYPLVIDVEFLAPVFHCVEVPGQLEPVASLAVERQGGFDELSRLSPIILMVVLMTLSWSGVLGRLLWPAVDFLFRAVTGVSLR